jgi:hypothetical protein
MRLRSLLGYCGGRADMVAPDAIDPFGLGPAREPTAATSIQSNSGLPQGPADLPLAGSTSANRLHTVARWLI